MNTKQKLLSLIRRQEVIYNTDLLEYKDNASRILAWKKIAEDMKMTAEDCKMEWSKLRNCFVNALRRRVSLQSRGKTLPPWLYEAEMSFLKPFMNGRGWDDTPYTILLPDHNYEIEHDATDTETKTEESETKVKKEKVRYKKKQKCPKIEDDTYEILEHNDDEILMNEDFNNDSFKVDYDISDSYKINKSQSILNEMDESDLFFLGLSRTFKKLPKIEQCSLKMEIFKILNDAEMRQLEGKRKRKMEKRRSSTE